MPSGVSTAPSGLSRPPQGQVVTSVENTRASSRAHDSRFRLERRRAMFKNPADRLPAALVLTANVASFVVYFMVDSPWWLLGFWALMLGPRGAMGAWSHHHQHCFTFRSTALDRVLELGYALQTGITTHLWVLHHVLGHHLHYLDQTKDESRWARRSGVKMGMIEYILSVTSTAYFRAYQVGRKHPRYLPAYVGAIAVTVALVTALVWYRPRLSEMKWEKAGTEEYGWGA